jgi:hypothetical protein
MLTVFQSTARLHDNFVLVPADKASNNIVFVYKYYYYECQSNFVYIEMTAIMVDLVWNWMVSLGFTCTRNIHELR